MDRAAPTAGPDRFWVRARAVVVGSVAFGTGVASHVAGGGLLPGPVAMTLLLVASILAAGRFLLVRAGAPRLVLLVVLGQTLAHAALSGLAGHRGDPATPAAVPEPVAAPEPVATAGRRTGNLFDHYESIVPTVQGSPAGPGVPGDWLTHQVEHFVAQGPAMVLAHLAGAVALGLFLAVGEHSLWRLLLLVAARRVVAAADGRALAVAAEVLAGQSRRRGPALVLGRTHLSTGPQRLDGDQVTRRGPPFVLAA